MNHDWPDRGPISRQPFPKTSSVGRPQAGFDADLRAFVKVLFKVLYSFGTLYVRSYT